jgi:hypothetical protein
VSTDASVQLMVEKAAVAEVVARFYNATQAYDNEGSDWEVLEDLIDDEITYLTQNLKDPAPVARKAFLEKYRQLHDVHLHGDRGSFYGLHMPVVTVEGDTASLAQHISICHWLSPTKDHSTWFYGVVRAGLTKGAAGWRISTLDVSNVARVEGHTPTIDAFHVHLEEMKTSTLRIS